MMRIIKSTFIILLFFSFNLKGQEADKEKFNIIEQRVDFLLDINEGGDADFTTLFEQLEFFYKHPINLNHSNKQELLSLGLLNDIQVNNLLKHIEKNGKLIRFEELQSIDGFRLEDILLIQPFTKIDEGFRKTDFSLSNIIKEGSSSLFIRYSRIIEEQEGFSPIDPQDLAENPNKRYLGSADKLFSRYRFNYGNKISLGVTAEKDAGEEFFKGSQKNGFDFYSAHLFAQDIGVIKQIAIGDFQAQFGQGLTFWSGLAFGRSPSVYSLKRNAPKLQPYTSVQEDLFLRGGGVTLGAKNVELTVFYSSKKQDANILTEDSTNSGITISSLIENGFHRTPGELEDKDAIRNNTIGSYLSYEKRNFNFGFITVHNQIEAKFEPNRRIYNQFSLVDNDNTNYGFDFSYLLKNWNFFGEISKSAGGGYGHTVGALVVLDPKLSLGIQNRNFERNFIPIQSNAIGESSNNVNEKGTFLGIEAQPHQHFILSAYADRFVFPWLRFQTDAPSNGNRLFVQLNYKPSKKIETYFRFRQRNRSRNDNNNSEGIDQLADENNSNYRLHFNYQVSSAIQIKSRIEYTSYQLGENEVETGLLIFQDLNYKKLGSPISFSIRYAFFDTDSYNSRIYAYENDVLYAFSIPAFNGSGSRFYLIIKYHFMRNVDFWLRYAQTYYTDRNIIGSGKDKILGNTKSEVKAQLRIKF